MNKIPSFIIALTIAAFPGIGIQATENNVAANVSAPVHTLRKTGAKIALTESGIIKSVTFSGGQLKAPSLELLKTLPALDTLILRKVVLKESLLTQLVELPQPRQIVFICMAIDDKQVKQIQRFKTVKTISLYGTRITDRGLDELQRGLPDTVIDFRRGALLGVRGKYHEDGVEIEQVMKGSAAEKGGMKQGDVITYLNDKALRDFRSLTSFISERRPGDKVTFKFHRGDDVISKDITLGQWGCSG